MSLEAVSAKRLRRQWEPEEKSWHDDALAIPWEEVQPPLHKATLFSLKNVFFFSHATAVQVSAIRDFSTSGNSAIVEAPTGSGKTLAFLIPLMERTVRACDAYVARHNRPPLTRNIIGVILSPSRTLAGQTFVVAKSLASRFPFNIQFALCDGVVEQAGALVRRLRSNTRGAGTFIVSTPADLADVVEAMSQTEGPARTEAGEDLTSLLASQDEQTRARYLAKQRRLDNPSTGSAAGPAAALETSRRAGGTAVAATTTTAAVSSRAAEGQTLRFYATEENRFLVVIDEADLVLHSPEMREVVSRFIDARCRRSAASWAGSTGGGEGVEGSKKAVRKKGDKPVKRGRAGGAVGMPGPVEDETDTRMPTDFAFVGATVATSEMVHQYARDLCRAAGTTLHLIASRSSEDFVSQLQNRYVVCEAYNFLPFLIQMMNLHASKKHFVFFNSYRALQFVQRLFGILCQGVRPLLFVKDVYTMYEGMTERTRMDQYNKFLTHTSSGVAPSATREKSLKAKQGLSDAQKRNQIFRGGWKRDGRAPMGTGAILLCTDIAAFGLDVRDVDYVYHFEPPATVQSYVHRVGRVGRMGMQGSSVLLLPCIVDAGQAGLENARERKTTSTRYNTITNTKNSTHDLQSTRLSVEDLAEDRRQYIKDLSAHSSLEEYNVPPFAPISATLRNVVAQDAKLLKLAKAAAMSMCQPIAEEKMRWFTPKLALRALLLD